MAEWVGWVVDGIFPERMKRRECVTATQYQQFEEICREYLILKFPRQAIRNNNATLEELESKGLIQDPKVRAEFEKILKNQKEFQKPLLIDQSNQSDIALIKAERDPWSEGFRQNLMYGPTLTPEERATGKTFSQKSHEVMLAPAPKGGYLETRHSAEMRALVTIPGPDGRMTRVPFREFIKEILDLNFEREKLVAEFVDERLALMQKISNQNLEADTQIELNRQVENVLRAEHQSRLNAYDEAIRNQIDLFRTIPEARLPSRQGG